MRLMIRTGRLGQPKGKDEDADEHDNHEEVRPAAGWSVEKDARLHDKGSPCS